MYNTFADILKRITLSNFFYALIMLLIIGILVGSLILIVINCPWYESLVIVTLVVGLCERR